MTDHAGRSSEATVYHRRALATDPEFASGRTNLGVALMELGKIREAEQHLRKALLSDPNHAGAHHNPAHLLGATRRPKLGIKHYRRALVSKPDFPEANNNLGPLLLNAGKVREAALSFLRAVKVKMDGDGQMDPEYMPSLFEPLIPDVELPCRAEHASRISRRFSPISGF